MERIINPVRERWVDLLKRPRMENADLQKICKAIFAEVLKDGDNALVLVSLTPKTSTNSLALYHTSSSINERIIS